MFYIYLFEGICETITKDLFKDFHALLLVRIKPRRQPMDQLSQSPLKHWHEIVNLKKNSEHIINRELDDKDGLKGGLHLSQTKTFVYSKNSPLFPTISNWVAPLIKLGPKRHQMLLHSLLWLHKYQEKYFYIEKKDNETYAPDRHLSPRIQQ